MSVRDERCNACGAGLVDAPPQTREAQSRRFRVVIRDIPARRCPRGCAGLYWKHLDVGVGAYDLLFEPETHFAKTRGILLWQRQACRGCGGKVSRGERRDFAFGPMAAAHMERMSMTVDGPTVVCGPCGKSYLPGKTREYDALHLELEETVGAAVAKDLIWDGPAS